MAGEEASGPEQMGQMSRSPAVESVRYSGRCGWNAPCARAFVCVRTSRWLSKASLRVSHSSTTPLCSVAARLLARRGLCATDDTGDRSRVGGMGLLLASRAVGFYMSAPDTVSRTSR